MPRTGVLDGGFVESFQGIEQSRNAPVEHVIVGESAAVDSRFSKAADIFRTHLVMNFFARPVGFAACDRRF